jgi:hypothetical protein
VKALVIRATVVVFVTIAGFGLVVSDRGGERAGSSTRDLAARGELASAGATYQDRRWGYTVAVPDGWHRVTTSLTPNLVDPREILAVATFPSARGDGLCDALERVPPAAAFVTVQERGRGAYGREGFPTRPAHFEPDPQLPGTSAWPYCAGGDDRPPIPMLDYWFGFSDAGRAFHVFVGIGKDAPPDVRRDAFRVLDSLRFDPAVKPGWRSSG